MKLFELWWSKTSIPTLEDKEDYKEEFEKAFNAGIASERFRVVQQLKAIQLREDNQEVDKVIYKVYDMLGV